MYLYFFFSLRSWYTSTHLSSTAIPLDYNGGQYVMMRHWREGDCTILKDDVVWWKLSKCVKVTVFVVFALDSQREKKNAAARKSTGRGLISDYPRKTGNWAVVFEGDCGDRYTYAKQKHREASSLWWTGNPKRIAVCCIKRKEKRYTQIKVTLFYSTIKCDLKCWSAGSRHHHQPWLYL